MKKNTDFKNERYVVEFTEQCIEEMGEIYEYISNILKAKEAAKRLMGEINQRILSLTEFPEQYMKIGKADRLKREYHRIVVKNYVVLYTIDYAQRKVFISRMIYGRRNYLEKLI